MRVGIVRQFGSDLKPKATQKEQWKNYQSEWECVWRYQHMNSIGTIGFQCAVQKTNFGTPCKKWKGQTENRQTKVNRDHDVDPMLFFTWIYEALRSNITNIITKWKKEKAGARQTKAASKSRKTNQTDHLRKDFEAKFASYVLRLHEQAYA